MPQADAAWRNSRNLPLFDEARYNSRGELIVVLTSGRYRVVGAASGTFRQFGARVSCLQLYFEHRPLHVHEMRDGGFGSGDQVHERSLVERGVLRRGLNLHQLA